MKGNQIQFHLSGAASAFAAQADSAASLGGFPSSSRVKLYKAFTTSGIAGVTIQAPGAGPAFEIGASIGTPVGAGNLDFVWNSGTGQTLQWTPPTGSPGTAVDVDAGGEFVLYGADSSAFLVVDVVEARYGKC